MKICTITCHDVYNHGASLQAFALMKYLENKGHSVQIIDYKPKYLSNHYNLLTIGNPKWEKNLLTKVMYLIIKIPSRLPSLRRKKAFDRFTSARLKLTKKRYISNNELKLNPPSADIFICGSDQIWNSLFENGRDPSFYLDFVPQGKISASYAASFATAVISEEIKDFVKEKVQRLDGISVREISGAKILADLKINNVVTVVDPVLLIDKKEWDTIATRKFNEKYILIYDFDNSELIKKIAIELKKETGFKIYSVNTTKLKYVDSNYIYEGPETFISLIRDAQIIVSNSFHAIIFSLIYEKNFVNVNRNEGINSRMKDLLTELDLEERIIKEKSYDIRKILNDINYKRVQEKMKIKQDVSEDYLKYVLSLGNGGESE